MNKEEAAEYVRSYFVSQFSDANKSPLEAHPPDPKPLAYSITTAEVKEAVKKLKNRRAVGLDGLSAELLKNGPPEMYTVIAKLLNTAMAQGEDLELGLAKLVTLPKPGKVAGPVKNIRPIALLPLLRKVLSLITLLRIRGVVDRYLSPAQSGFRPGRSCADIVWAHRWLAAKSLRYKAVIHVLGLDMSRAFDTIDRAKLMSILDTVPGLTDDDRRLIRVLLANTSIQVNFNGVVTAPFTSTIGSPQGDALSPILFAIYLEAAIRELIARGPKRPQCDLNIHLPLEAIYADDTDFISMCAAFLDDIQSSVGPIFKELDLIVNVDKTERTIVGHSDLVADQSWRTTRKLGSLLGVEEDVNRRIQLAFQSMNSLEAMWKHRDLVAKRIRVHSYRAIVESVLLYNCGTWALTEALADRLDRFQRKMLRRILGLKWSDKVTNEKLYARCGIPPASVQVLNARWRLFGHTLRMDENAPARQAMAYYFVKDQPGRQGNRVTIASALSNEYKAVVGKPISNSAEYEAVVCVAQDRDVWKDVVQQVTQKQVELRQAKVQKRTERRHETKKNRAA